MMTLLILCAWLVIIHASLAMTPPPNVSPVNLHICVLSQGISAHVITVMLTSMLMELVLFAITPVKLVLGLPIVSV